ncbi:ATP-binding protein [Patescibacteria group bacterium]|nr:ATP-binding protein [Patescibacteria group bacterium]
MNTYIRQDLYDELESRLNGEANLIQVIIGPRQVGKTTLALQLLEKWQGSTLYETADQPGTPSLAWLEEVWQSARALPDRNVPTLLVVDEVQKIPRWSDLTKKLFDEDKIAKRNLRVVILGSSSLLVQRGLQESLAGRFELHRHYQWSYSECKEAFGLSLPEYLYFGGYPGGLALREDPVRWARYIRDSLIETVLAKDIFLMSPVSKPVLLRQTFSLATGYPAQILSYQKMIGSLTDAGNVTTIASYLKLLASAFLVLPLERFSGTLIKQRGSVPKIIVFDNALVSAMNNLNKDDVRDNPTWQGRIVENALGARIQVAIEKQGGELSYWRERDKEVDFVVRVGKSLLAIEVKSGQLKESLGGLEYFLKKYPEAKGLVICDRHQESDSHAGIPKVDLEDFLLDPDSFLSQSL